MTKAVDGALGVAEKTVADREVYAGRAERQHGLAGLIQPDANGAGSVITAAGYHRHRRHTPTGGDVGVQLSGNLVAFEQRGHLTAAQPAGIKQIIIPVSSGDIHPQRARRIGHVAGEIAGQAPAQVILWQQHFVDLPENIRLVLLHPLQLRGGKAGHHQVAGDAASVRHLLLQLPALRGAASIVPQNGRPQHPLLRIQQRRAMHLAGQPDGSYPLQRLLRGQPGQGGVGCLPPLLRVLFRPQRVRA